MLQENFEIRVFPACSSVINPQKAGVPLFCAYFASLCILLFVFHFRHLLAAAKRKNITEHFVWVASDGWGQQELPVRDNEDAAEGALTIGSYSCIVVN